MARFVLHNLELYTYNIGIHFINHKFFFAEFSSIGAAAETT